MAKNPIKKKMVMICTIFILIFGISVYFFAVQGKKDQKVSKDVETENQTENKPEKETIQKEAAGNQLEKETEKEEATGKELTENGTTEKELTGKETIENEITEKEPTQDELIDKETPVSQEKGGNSENSRTMGQKERDQEETKEEPQRITGDTDVDFEEMIENIDGEIEKSIQETLPEQDFQVNIDEPVLPE